MFVNRYLSWKIVQDNFGIKRFWNLRLTDRLNSLLGSYLYIGRGNESRERIDPMILWTTEACVRDGNFSSFNSYTYIFRVKGHETLRQWCIIQLGWLTGEGTLKGRKIVPFTTHSWLSRKLLLIHEDGFRVKTVSLHGPARTMRVCERLFSVGS